MSKATNRVWMWGDPAAPTFPEDLYDLAKSALFQDPAQPQHDEDVAFRLVELHTVPREKESSPDDGGSTSSYFRYRVVTHTGMLLEMQDEKCGTKECHYATSSDEALGIYAKIYSTYSTFHKTKKFLSRWIGSQVYRNQALETGLRDGPPISDEVARLVEYVWREAMGELRDILSVPYRKIGMGKVEKAEGILLQIRKSLDQNGEEEDVNELNKLNREFYKLIPHQRRREEFINSRRIIASKQELCQLIKDIVNVSESTDWLQRSSSQSRYRALQCFLNFLPPDHPEFEKIKSFLMDTKSSEEPLEIKRIFAATRGVEETTFDGTIDNNKLLVHASRPANFLGIMSRGLLLPKIVVEVFGGSRRDAGMLGSGIYFGDKVSTAQQYSSPSQHTGTRLMVVNKVALGNVKELFAFDTTIDQAPEGYHSTHGVSRDSIYPKESEFKDDEYVVYETNQQCIRYLVEFTLPGDSEIEMPLCETPLVAEGAEEIIFCQQTAVESSARPTDIDLGDVECARDPVAGVDVGLVSQNDTSDSVTLQAVHVRAKLLDLVAEVVVLQSYRNNSDEVMEAKYVFPIDESAAVCGFEAFINDKHVVGVVKEKQVAHKEYRQAVEEGHGAYLMDEESTHVFSVSVGNLPPQADVLIKVTYVTELSVEGEKLAFNLLGTVAPWKRQEVLAKGTPSWGDAVDVELETIHKEQSIQLAMTMASKIKSIESPTHSILVKQSDNKASIQLGKDSKLEDGFQLLIGLEEIHKPRMWLENAPGSEEQAAMLVFYPELDVGTLDNPEMVLVLDSSNSMKGQSIEDGKKLLLLILQNLPSRCTFNVVVFGTEFDELFPTSQQKTKDNIKKAKEFIKDFTVGQEVPTSGAPSVTELAEKESTHRNIFLVTDGHLNNEEATLRAVGRNRAFTRVFTCGVSTTANRHLLAAVARHGGGAYECFDSAAKSTWERKVKLQVSRATQPAVTSVSVKWNQQGSSDQSSPLQAPAQITSLFRKNRLIVYGLVQNCIQATLFAEINGKNVETVLSAVDYPNISGKIIHQLAARAVIRDWEEGVLHADRLEHEAQKNELTSRIVELSMRHSIVTPLTSFIAVEERDEDEQKQISEGKAKIVSQSVDKLLASEDVDQLTDLQWEDPSSDKKPELSPLKFVSDLLQTANTAADFYSFKTAEKYFTQAYEVAKEKLSYTQPITLKVAHSFSKFCARVKQDMGQAFDLVNSAFLETKNTLPEVQETTVIEDISMMDDLDSLQQAVEWAETCKIELERQRLQPGKSSDKPASLPLPSGISQQEEEELMGWIEEGESALEVSTSSWDDKPKHSTLDLESDLAESAAKLASLDVLARRKPERNEDLFIQEASMAMSSDVYSKTIGEMPMMREESVLMPEPVEMYSVPMAKMKQSVLMPEPVKMYSAPMARMKQSVSIPMVRMEKSEKIEIDSMARMEQSVLMPEPVEMYSVPMARMEQSVSIPEPVEMYSVPMARMEQSVSMPEPMRQPIEVRRQEPITIVSSCAYAEPLELEEELILAPMEPMDDSFEMSEERALMPKPIVSSLKKKKKAPRPGSKSPASQHATEPVSSGSLPPPPPPGIGSQQGASPPQPPPPIPGASPRPAFKGTESEDGVHACVYGDPGTPLPAFKETNKDEDESEDDDYVCLEYNYEDLVTDTVGSPDPKTSRSDTERLINMQQENGSWVFSSALDEILGIDHFETISLVRERLQSVCSEQGVTVDIRDVFDQILQIMATIMTCVHMETRVLSPDLPQSFQESVNKTLIIARAFLEVCQVDLGGKFGVQIDWTDMGTNLLLTGTVE